MCMDLGSLGSSPFNTSYRRKDCSSLRIVQIGSGADLVLHLGSAADVAKTQYATQRYLSVAAWLAGFSSYLPVKKPNQPTTKRWAAGFSSYQPSELLKTNCWADCYSQQKYCRTPKLSWRDSVPGTPVRARRLLLAKKEVGIHYC